MTCAFEALRSGWTVTVVEPDGGRSSAWVAGGMLAPAAEAHFGEEPLVRFLEAGAERWPGFAASVEAASGMSIGYVSSGTLLVARDAADRAELRRTIEFQRSLDLPVIELSTAELRALEPSLSPSIAAGAELREDHQVSNRALLEALRAALGAAGARLISEEVTRIDSDSLRPGIVTATGARLEADALVVAMGARGAELLETSAELPTIRPVKGHILRLRGPEPLLTRTIRASVRGRSVYLVPRRDGELVVGATVEERGFDTTVEVGQVFALLEDARKVVPGVDELELVEAACGLRPGTSSNAPVIQRLPEGPIVFASGHYRNGILLAPLTAEMIIALLSHVDHPAAGLLRAVEAS